MDNPVDEIDVKRVLNGGLKDDVIEDVKRDVK